MKAPSQSLSEIHSPAASSFILQRHTRRRRWYSAAALISLARQQTAFDLAAEPSKPSLVWADVQRALQAFRDVGYAVTPAEAKQLFEVLGFGEGGGASSGAEKKSASLLPYMLSQL